MIIKKSGNLSGLRWRNIKTFIKLSLMGSIGSVESRSSGLMSYSNYITNSIIKILI